MNFIKILLFSLLATILFFVYLEVEKTDNSVMISQSFMHHKPKDEHVLYRDGKRITVSSKAYAKLEAIPSTGKTLHTNLEQTAEVSEIKTLKLEGNIPEGVSYNIKVFYTSDTKGYICGRTTFSLGLFGGKSGFYLTSSTKKVTYAPIIKDGHHSIEVPLAEFRPILGCNYHLSLIQITITNINLQKYNVNYGGHFTLFFPKGKSSSHVTRGSPYNHNIGQTLNVECTAKDFSDKISYFNPNCHLQSTINTFFTKQELKYNKYELNINTTTQNEYELKRFLRNKSYTSGVKFIEKVSTFPKLYEQNLSYFTQKVEKLEQHQENVDKYLQEMKKRLSKILKNKKAMLSNENIKFLENKFRILAQSIQSHKKVKEIQKELLYDTHNINNLDTLNSKIKINKLFLNNEFYKYQMLHFVNISQKDPHLISNQLYKLREAHSKVNESFSRTFLNCRKSHNTICEQLKRITTDEKEVDKKELLKSIKNIEILLFLQNRRNLYFL